MIEALLPQCYGRLELTTEEIEEKCLCDVEAMLEGWHMRYKDARDLFILYSAMPVINTFSKRKVRYEDLLPQEESVDSYSDMTLDEMRALASE